MHAGQFHSYAKDRETDKQIEQNLIRLNNEKGLKNQNLILK